MIERPDFPNGRGGVRLESSPVLVQEVPNVDIGVPPRVEQVGERRASQNNNSLAMVYGIGT